MLCEIYIIELDKTENTDNQSNLYVIQRLPENKENTKLDVLH